MNKACLLKLTLILIILASLALFTKAICDSDVTLETLCNSNDVFQYSELLINISSRRQVFYGRSNDAISPEPIISYLARQEKSPPAGAVLSLAA
ncbi:MAG: hypothetical protein PHQ96_09410 [Candidatus Omnitrophica bacterium]|nr:hypothetical protein [Candidatus Omnitrophota bacterium]